MRRRARARTSVVAGLAALAALAVACGPIDDARSPDDCDDVVVDAGSRAYAWPPRVEQQPRFRLVFHVDGGAPRP